MSAMGYTDAQGRPELIAQPFVKTGAAVYRKVDQQREERDPRSAIVGELGSGKKTQAPAPDVD